MVEDTEGESPDGIWYLGLDVGTTGISAALLNLQTCQLYPITWVEAGQNRPESGLERLPAIGRLPIEQSGNASVSSLAIGSSALELQVSNQANTPAEPLLTHFKHYLNVTIPYVPAYSPTWEPELQWSDSQKVSLVSIQRVLVELLATLSAQQSRVALTCICPALSPAALQTVLGQLTGVIVGCPTGWSDAYSFNLREALLATGLVQHPEQVLFVEDAIAAILTELPIPNSLNSGDISYSPQSITRGGAALQGNTLVISAGATITELLLVNLLPQSSDLTYQDCALRSIEYAGNAIDQDILCQLLLPLAKGWNLDLQNLDLPLLGEPDLQARYRLQQRLQSTMLGQGLLATIRQLKQTLRQQESAEFTLHEQQWTITEQELNGRVILPYIQRLNRELNTLLTQTGITVQAVRQVICTGGTTTFVAIEHWLKQKFPNAVLIQDGDRSFGTSRIASGLARVPLYPQVVNSVRHQYSEYFLLRELLRVLPDEPLPLGRILQLLENQGINTQACQRTILNLLEGQTPAGLIPARADASLLTLESRRNPDYQVLAASLFSRQNNQVYLLNPNLREQLHQYLDAVLANSIQTMEEPLTVNLAAEASV